MDDEPRQIKLYVNGYLAAWGTTDAAHLHATGCKQVDLHTDKAHDPYGLFDDVTVYIEAQPHYFQPDAQAN